MARIIGIAGHANSGKDTLADLICKYCVGLRHTISFADPIRDVTSLMGLAIYDRECKEEVITRRYAHLEGSLIDAINKSILYTLLTEDERCELYVFMMEALADGGHIERGRQDHLTISPRRFAELLGTEAGRRMEDGLWIRLLRKRAEKLDGIVVVSDVRFLNEASAVDFLVGITRKTELVSNHASARDIESLVRRANIRVTNDSTLDELRKAAEFIALYHDDDILNKGTADE